MATKNKPKSRAKKVFRPKLRNPRNLISALSDVDSLTLSELMTVNSQVIGLTYNVQLPNLYTLVTFVNEKEEDRQRYPGFNEAYEASGRDHIRLWSQVSGTLVEALGWDYSAMRFSGSLIEGTLGHIIETLKTKFMWEITVEYSMIEFGDTPEILGDIMLMTPAEVEAYAATKNLDLGSTEMTFTTPERTVAFDRIMEDGEEVFVCMHYVKDDKDNYVLDDDGSKIPNTVAALGYSVATADMRDSDPVYDKYETVNLKIKATVIGVK